YTDAAIFEKSKTDIFLKTWQFASLTQAAQLHGSNKPFTLLPGFLDEPLLITNQNNQHQCLSNVCTHRGKILVENACMQNHIRCRYHGRKFDLNGNMLSMPEFEDVKNFPAPTDHLTQLQLKQWLQMFFVAATPAMDFEVCIDPIRPFIKQLSTDYIYQPTLSRDYLVQAHWALYCENYLEGFHIPFVHHDLNKTLDYSSYHTQCFKYSSLQIGYAQSGYPTLPIQHNEKSIAALYYWMFPNTMLNFYPWGLSVNVVKPITPHLTRVSFICFAYPNADVSGQINALDKVEREDEAIVESVQKGIGSRFYKHGRYATKRETGTHHFHGLIAEFL
ncbi:MAG TPA: SRPBCC family protein, partial [Bacteroidia bacterium]|nr:SRPBCC family protein [Bacteroidia bacterium]